MQHRRILENAVIIALILFGIFSGGMFLHRYVDARRSRESFEELSDLIAKAESAEEQPAETAGEDVVSVTATTEAADFAGRKYAVLYEQNSDFIGWIDIADTHIHYPVMYTPNTPNYYLKRSFQKTYSDYGVPYMDEACVLGVSNNIILYGHHMLDGSMFADLCQYAEQSFYAEHQKIQWDTLSTSGEYQVVAAFRFNVDEENFRYNECTQMDKTQFAAFMENVHARQLYDTGISVEYGDQLLTLSTCEYSYKNGRFVVIAKKV